MISAVLIYGQRGEILASRIYKDGLRRAVTDAFRIQVVTGSESSSPLLTLGSTSFLHIRYNSLFVVAVTRHDVDGAAVFEFLYKLCDVCTAQLGQFDEASCYRNVTQIYEILDELVDYGYPQNTEPSVLKQYLSGGPMDSIAGDSMTGGSGGVVSALKRTMSSAGSTSSLAGSRDTNRSAGRQSKLNTVNEVSWRSSDVKHRRNEVYVDVIEQINAVFSPEGDAVSASVDGRVAVKSHLSGLPQCQIDLSQNTVLENSQLHSCVDHTRFHNSGVVRFIPPEGEFELLYYRVTRGIKLPLTLLNSYAISDGEHSIRVRCPLDSNHHLTNVAILVPIPTSAGEPKRAKCSNGKAKFVPEHHAIEWKIGRLAGQHEATLRIRAPESLAAAGQPITAKFLINMYASSGLKVQSLQVVEESMKYGTLKWVRYLTQAGAVEARLLEGRGVGPNSF